MLKTKIKNLIFNEAIGDFAGADTFQGGPFGYGADHQLKKVQHHKELTDPEEQKKKRFYGNLDSLKDPPMQLDLPLNEREASDILYRDLPGWPPVNTLSKPENFVPKDKNDNNEEIDMDTVSLTSLIPMNKLEKFGHRPLNPDNTANDWTETSGENIKNVTGDGRYNLLVHPENYQSDEYLDQISGFNRLNDEDDVNTRPGNMANLVMPKKYIQEPAPVYEESEMKTKEIKKFNELENKKNYIPKLSKKTDKQKSGDGVALKTKKEASNIDKNEKLQPYKYSSKPEELEKILEKITEGIIHKIIKSFKKSKK